MVEYLLINICNYGARIANTIQLVTTVRTVQLATMAMQPLVHLMTASSVPALYPYLLTSKHKPYLILKVSYFDTFTTIQFYVCTLVINVHYSI